MRPSFLARWPRSAWLLLLPLTSSGCERLARMLAIMYLIVLGTTALAPLGLLAASMRSIDKEQPNVVPMITLLLLGLPLLGFAVLVAMEEIADGRPGGRFPYEAFVLLPWIPSWIYGVRAWRDTPTTRVVGTLGGILIVAVFGLCVYAGVT